MRSTWNTHRKRVTRRSAHPWPTLVAPARRMRDGRSTFGTHPVPEGSTQRQELAGTFHVEHGRSDRLRTASPDASRNRQPVQSHNGLTDAPSTSRLDALAHAPGSGEAFHVEHGRPGAVVALTPEASGLAVGTDGQNWLKHVPRGTGTRGVRPRQLMLPVAPGVCPIAMAGGCSTWNTQGQTRLHHPPMPTSPARGARHAGRDWAPHHPTPGWLEAGSPRARSTWNTAKDVSGTFHVEHRSAEQVAPPLMDSSYLRQG
jgi:hypothetical protein